MFNLTNLCHVIVKVEATELKVGWYSASSVRGSDIYG
jgi:hypothetical protein